NKAMYYCFGCHASGDIIKFVSEIEKNSFADSVKYLADVAGLVLPKLDKKEQKKIEQKLDLVEVTTKAAKWFNHQLKLSSNHHAYEYLIKRGIGDDDIKVFSLGFAPEKGLLSFLQKEKISPELAVEVGLAIKSDNGSYIERFRNRVIFPIKNQKNQIVGFGGRALSSEIMPKYLNSPETILFKKNYLLYCGEIAHKAALKSERVIVVEGYMDAIFMQKIGLKETVASLGTAFNHNHLQLLWNMANDIILCFDGDAAGKKAMIKAAHTALPIIKPGLTLRFCMLPKDLDPDDAIRQLGKDYIYKSIENSINLSEFIWESELQKSKLNTPEAKASFEHKLNDLIKQIEDNIVRNYYLKFIKEKIWKEFNHFTPKTKEPPVIKARKLSNNTYHNISEMERLQFSLFAQVINHTDLLDEKEIFDDFVALEINNPELELVRSTILDYYENQEILLKDLLIRNNLGKLTEFICGDNSSFINNISLIDVEVAKEIWIITY
ncbi:MAG: DNA primase, partial [Pseudomonadota bacterium]